MEVHVERLQPLQHRQPDPARRHRADMHALDVVGAGRAIGDVPAAVENHLVRGQIVADQRQDHHHDMLGDADRVAIGHLGDGDAPLHRGLEVGMVRADPGGHDHLEVPRPADPLGGHVSGPERLRDDDVGVDELAVERRIRAVLVGGHDQAMAVLSR